MTDPKPPYSKSIYDGLKNTYGDKFKLSYEEFDKKVSSDEEYSASIYSGLKNTYGDKFKLTPEEFTGKLKKKEDTAPVGPTEEPLPSPYAQDSGDGSPDTPATLSEKFNTLQELNTGSVNQYNKVLADMEGTKQEITAFDQGRLSSPEGVNEFNLLVDDFNSKQILAEDLFKESSNRDKEIRSLQQKYKDQNLDRQFKLFEALDLDEEDFVELQDKINKEKGPDRNISDLDAEEIANLMTGKSYDQAMEDATRIMEYNPIKSMIRKGWETLGYQLPASGASFLSVTLADFKDLFRVPEAFSPAVHGQLNKGDAILASSKKEVEDMLKMKSKMLAAVREGKASKDDYNKFVSEIDDRMKFLQDEGLLKPKEKDGVDKMRNDLLSWAAERQDKGAEMNKDLVDTLDEIDDPLDALNWIGSALGQATAQIAPSVLTYGGSSFVQEIGSIYLDQIQEVGRKEGLSIQEVMDKNLDDPASAIAYGSVAGMLDKISAGNLIKSIGKKELKNSLRVRALNYLADGGLEAVTEGSQTVLEQIGAGREIDSKEIIEASAQGFVGGVGISSVGGESGNKSVSPEVKINTPLGDLGVIKEEEQVTPPKKEAPKVKLEPKPKPKVNDPVTIEGQKEDGDNVGKKERGDESPNEGATTTPKAEPNRPGEYYRRSDEGGFEKIDNAKPVEGFGRDFFSAVNPEGEVEIIEGQSGAKVAAAPTLDEAKQQVVDRFAQPDAQEKFDNAVKSSVEQAGVSPRYQKPEATKSQEKPKEQAPAKGKIEEKKLELDPDLAKIDARIIDAPKQNVEGATVAPQPVRLDDISKDLERFQNRREEFSQRSHDSIVDAVKEGTFDLAKFDAVKLWGDQKVSKTYVLAGHSRIGAFETLRKFGFENLSPEAQENLRSQGIYNFETIPGVLMARLNEDEAIRYAKDESNTLSTAETDMAGALRFAEYEKQGKGAAEIRKIMKGRKNLARVELLAAINPKGQAAQDIKAVESTETVDGSQRVYQIAEFMGRARRMFPDLTDSHENEMYKYLTTGNGKKITTRNEFIARMDGVVNNVQFKQNPEAPLNLDNVSTKGFNETVIDAEIQEKEKRLSELQKELRDKRTPPGPQRVDEITREQATINKALVQLNYDKAAAHQGDKLQTDLFKPAPKATPKPETDPAPKKSDRIKDDIDDLFKELDSVLGNSLSSGVNPDAAIIAGKIVGAYINRGVTRMGEILQDVYSRYGEKAFRNYFNAIKGGYASQLATLEDVSNMTPFDEVRNANVDTYLTQFNEPSATNNLEPDSERLQPGDQLGKEDVQTDGDRSGDVPKGREGEVIIGEDSREGDNVVSGSDAVTYGDPSNPGVRIEQPLPSERIDRGDEPGGSNTTNDVRTSSEQSAAPTADNYFTTSREDFDSDLNAKLILQQHAEQNPVIIKNPASIKSTLPYLLPDQQRDVMLAEERFFPEAQDKGKRLSKGIMFTNGTGTGKTYTGLGIAKRFHRQGKKNILIVTPTDTKVKDWIEDAKNLLIDVHELKSTKDMGVDGVPAATTYANFRQNEALLTRDFDLVLYDESHRINSNQAGGVTAAEIQHKKLTKAPNEAYSQAMDEFNYQGNLSKISEKYGEHSNEYRQARDKLKAKVLERTEQLIEQTKVVFLSATPFAYHKSLGYADGYLYTIKQNPYEKPGFSGYNQPDSEDSFYITNFGYQMKYNRLQKPETGVNVGLMERDFQQKLEKQGALSSRKLDIPYDYSRQFIMADDKMGHMIDEGMRIINEEKSADGKSKWKHVSAISEKKFNYNYTSQLMEAIKARKAVDRISKHLAMGRKVVVFHSYVNNLPSHPFDFLNVEYEGENLQSTREINEEIAAFNKAHPEYSKMDLEGLANPPSTLKEAFPDALLFNGKESKKNKRQAVKDFNNDKSGKNLIVVQMESGKEGISLHDVTGSSQRVVMNLGLPIRPTDAVQTEGRIYRVGQKSNAIMEYPVLHTSFERHAFGQKVNERVKTVENLALGHQARDLDIAFKEGYKDVIDADPNAEQGIGGKTADVGLHDISDFERSKTYYYSRQKKTSKTKSAEGTDYYATPEPVGYKMVEWLYERADDEHLEPSAGHGAIARFFNEQTNNTVVEPSYDLRGDLSINASFGRMVESDFESLHISNKYDGIVMNPPYGSGGKMAMDHLEKAVKHLRDKGRVIAIVPDGPAFDSRLEKAMKEDAFYNAYLVAEIKLPSATFKRAGTSVVTKILVFDKQISEVGKSLITPTKNIDLSQSENVEALFDNIEDLDLPQRYRGLENKSSKPTPSYSRDAETGAIEVSAEITPFNHTKTGEELHSVKIKTSLNQEEYAKVREKAKELESYWSRFAKGFLFKDHQKAQQLIDFIQNGFQDNDLGAAENLDVYNMLDNSKSAPPMSKYENRVRHEDGTPVRISDEVKKLSKKYNPTSTLGQGYVSRGSEGTYYGQTGNVRLKGLNNLSAALHELTHAIDKRTGLVEKVIKETKVGDPLRREITNLYVKEYPNARASDPLYKRITEGYAMLIQRYIENPTRVKNEYSNLYERFISPGGEFTIGAINEFIADAEGVITQYQSMKPLEKYASKMSSSDTKKTPPKKSVLQKSDEQIFDEISMAEELARRDGTHMTSDDFSLWIRLGSNAIDMAHRNISNKFGKFWSMDESGSFKKKLDYNYNSLRKLIGKDRIDDFGGFLIARRYYFDHQYTEQLKDDLSELEAGGPEKISEELGIEMEEAVALYEIRVSQIQEQIEKNVSILKNENIYNEEGEIYPEELSDMESAYNTGKDLFSTEEAMFDNLMAEDVLLASNKNVQLIDKDRADKYLANEGYAPFKRVIYDELVDEQDGVVIKTASNQKIGSFLQRRGGQAPVLNPFESATLNHVEIMRKSMRQVVYNKMAAVAGKHPEFMQRVAYKPGMEKDPNIIMAKENYKNAPILLDEDLHHVVNEAFDFHNAHLIEHSLVFASQLFRAGTTSLWPPFAIANLTVDQMSAIMNSNNGFIPIVSSLKHMTKPAINVLSRGMLFKDSEESQYLQEYLYLANTSQTFYSGNRKDTQRIKDKLLGSRTGAKRVSDYFSKIVDFMAIPGNASEILTRGTEYIAARKAGKTQVVALEEAGRVTTPFHHMGKLGGKKDNQIGKTWVKSVPYWNASLQVLRQTGRALNTKKGRARAAFTFAAISAASISSVLRMLEMDDDDPRKQILTSAPPDILTKYMFFPHPFDDRKLMKIRVVDQLNFVPALINMYLIESSGAAKYSKQEYLDASTAWIPQQINFTQPIQALFSLIPQLFKTEVEIATNTKAWPNVRPIETEGDQQKLPELRFNKYNSPLARELGELAGMSPKKIDHLLEGHMGRSVKFVTGKESLMIDFGKTWDRELYTQSGRQVQYMYDAIDRVAARMKAHTDRDKVLKGKELKEVSQMNEMLADARALLEGYNQIDEEKYPLKADNIRAQYFKLILKIQKLDYK